jgi:hypothetical protein
MRRWTLLERPQGVVTAPGLAGSSRKSLSMTKRGPWRVASSSSPLLPAGTLGAMPTADAGSMELGRAWWSTILEGSTPAADAIAYILRTVSGFALSECTWTTPP